MTMCYTIDRDIVKAYVFKSIAEMKDVLYPLAIETGKTYTIYELMGHGRIIGEVKPTPHRGTARFITA